MTINTKHFSVLRKYDAQGRKWSKPYAPGTYPAGGFPDGRKIRITRYGYIAKGTVWSGWGCVNPVDKEPPCDECMRDWDTLLQQVRDGAMKKWPKEVKYIPSRLKADFLQAFLEGKIKRGG